MHTDFSAPETRGTKKGEIRGSYKPKPEGWVKSPSKPKDISTKQKKMLLDLLNGERVSAITKKYNLSKARTYAAIKNAAVRLLQMEHGAHVRKCVDDPYCVSVKSILEAKRYWRYLIDRHLP